jgi:FtsP/CotA-like multicopper oxidase with cupredoxin domain
MTAACQNHSRPERTNVKTTMLKIWTCGALSGLVMLAANARGEWLNQTTGDSLGNHLVDGITGPAFTLTAKEGHISTAEGASVYVWGFANGNGPMQYPGPTLIVNQGDNITITLSNTLPFSVSMVFPGQGTVTASGGNAGLLTQEAPAGSPAISGGSVTYSFTASQPGTYLYNSGTRQDLQIEMGMVGAIIVRPTGFSNTNKTTWKSYATADSTFDQEFLFLLTEMDPGIHGDVEHQMEAFTAAVRAPPFNPVIDTTKHFANYWFINGRTGPDTMMIANSRALPAQPYDAFPMMHPGQNLLMRMVGGGRDPHPFHHHANHARNIARNGRLLQSSPAAANADLSYLTFTIPTYPGETTDAIFTWTGSGLGWDIYGHSLGDPLRPYEDPNDHGKPFPVTLSTEQDMEFGQWYSGSPFLGVSASLPPGLGGFDPTSGFIYMWHSHAEREIVNNNVFPGGMLTMLLVEPW